jgi:hypothetical protein
VVEINPRYTMGRLTVELMKHTCPGSCGLFRLVTRAQAERRVHRLPAACSWEALPCSRGEAVRIHKALARMIPGGGCASHFRSVHAESARFARDSEPAPR